MQFYHFKNHADGFLCSVKGQAVKTACFIYQDITLLLNLLISRSALSGKQKEFVRYLFIYLLISFFIGVLFGLYMGAGLWGGACLGGALISFTGIRTAYQLLAGVAFIMLIMFGVSSRMANTDDDDEQSEGQYQAILTEDLEDVDKN
mgnify:CR=1 FL=1